MPTETEVKSTLKSKTMIYNALGTAAEVAVLVEGIVPITWAPWMLLAKGIINIILRQFTTQPVSIRG